jgi:hypothetical protein
VNVCIKARTPPFSHQSCLLMQRKSWDVGAGKWNGHVAMDTQKTFVTVLYPNRQPQGMRSFVCRDKRIVDANL